MTTITISELPEALQKLLQQINQTGEPLTIMQGERPFALISPVQSSQNGNNNLLATFDKIGRNAQSKGLTEEILEELLADES